VSRPPCVLALDQGTTSTRAMAFDARGRVVAVAQEELAQHYPRAGWVEHDAEAIWRATSALARQVVGEAESDGYEVVALGLTNQRETTVLWERGTGRPVHNAIVWQDRRTADRCRALADAGHGDAVRERTGLLIDPYFSATKVAWLLEHVPEAERAAAREDLAFGTVDSFLLWRLTGGAVHATDATNASRTMLFDIHRQRWDEGLLEALGIPPALMPEVRDSVAQFGTTTDEAVGKRIPVLGIAGDQQAAAVGQVCIRPGMVKSTYGTGCFVLAHTGDEPVASQNRLLTTVALRIDGRASYSLEGSIFVAGAAVQWLRDGLGLIADAAETEALAAGLEDNGGVYMVPAFTGLGAPWWDPDARGALLGLTRATRAGHLARAALEAVCFQTRDLADAMVADSGRALAALRVDGGMVANDWLCQFLADVTGIEVERPGVSETTALGAAYLAGLGAGVWESFEALESLWRRDAAFAPRMDADARERLVAGWQDAVRRVLSHGRGAGVGR